LIFLKKDGGYLFTCNLRPFKSEEYIEANAVAVFVAVEAAEEVELTE